MTDEDPPISAEELAELHRVRVGKPPDYAMPKDNYRNPEACAKYLREKIDAERKARWKDED